MNLPFDQKAVIPEKSVRQLARLAVEMSRAKRVTKTLKIKVPEKVDAVHWSTHSDRCSVQIGFLPRVKNGVKKPAFPRIQVWLLKSDGNVIPYINKPRTFGISNAGYRKYSILYRFPHAAQTETVALVVSIDGQFFMERLTPNADDKTKRSAQIHENKTHHFRITIPEGWSATSGS